MNHSLIELHLRELHEAGRGRDSENNSDFYLDFLSRDWHSRSSQAQFVGGQDRSVSCQKTYKENYQETFDEPLWPEEAAEDEDCQVKHKTCHNQAASCQYDLQSG